jgi:transcriptional regulator with XRE-family HTH domain
MSSHLLTTTLALLGKDERPMTQIAHDTGLTEAWLRDLWRGRMAEPSVVKIERLYNNLAPRDARITAKTFKQ